MMVTTECHNCLAYLSLESIRLWEMCICSPRDEHKSTVGSQTPPKRERLASFFEGEKGSEWQPCTFQAKYS